MTLARQRSALSYIQHMTVQTHGRCLVAEWKSYNSCFLNLLIVSTVVIRLLMSCICCCFCCLLFCLHATCKVFDDIGGHSNNNYTVSCYPHAVTWIQLNSINCIPFKFLVIFDFNFIVSFNFFSYCCGINDLYSLNITRLKITSWNWSCRLAGDTGFSQQ